MEVISTATSYLLLMLALLRTVVRRIVLCTYAVPDRTPNLATTSLPQFGFCEAVLSRHEINPLIRPSMHTTSLFDWYKQTDDERLRRKYVYISKPPYLSIGPPIRLGSKQHDWMYVCMSVCVYECVNVCLKVWYLRTYVRVAQSAFKCHAGPVRL